MTKRNYFREAFTKVAREYLIPEGNRIFNARLPVITSDAAPLDEYIKSIPIAGPPPTGKELSETVLRSMEESMRQLVFFIGESPHMPRIYDYATPENPAGIPPGVDNQGEAQVVETASHLDLIGAKDIQLEVSRRMNDAVERLRLTPPQPHAPDAPTNS